MPQHISARIPWKDNGYDGNICSKPCYNTSCLRLKNIAADRNDDFEEKLANNPILGHEKEIPCLAEGGCFMSEKTYITYTIHPYAKSKLLINGSTRKITVFVVTKDKNIYIPQNMYDLFENELCDIDGINVVY